MTDAHDRISLLTARTRLRCLAAAAAFMSIAACGGDAGGNTTAPASPAQPVPPVSPPSAIPGRLVANFTTPNPDDGAVLLTLSGGTLDSIAVAPGSTSGVLSSRASATSVRLILLATPAQTVKTGALVTFWVPDIGAVARYSGSVEQVAARATYVQRPLDGYSIRVAKQ